MGIPLITIGITCFNAAPTIGRAVSSAVLQDWPKKEIIVVDDGSTDGSWEVLEDLAERQPIIRIRHEQNKGVASARNTLIGAAQGEFISFFDDDDESYPYRVTKQWGRIVEYECRNNCRYVLCTAARDVANSGKVHQSKGLGERAPEPHGKIVADYFLGLGGKEGIAWGRFGAGVLTARVSVLRELEGFDPEFRRWEEWDLAIRAALKGAHFIAVDEPLIRQHETSSPKTAPNLDLEYALRLRKKNKSYLVENRLYWASRAMARCKFHGGKGRPWRSRVYLCLACLSSPVFLRRKLAGKLGVGRRCKAPGRFAGAPGSGTN
jgi:glycosyltransferase involved in cell wall biosynthesis